MSQATEKWEKLAAEVKEDQASKETFDALDNLDKSLAGVVMPEEAGFRLPYSSRPKVANSRWK